MRIYLKCTYRNDVNKEVSVCANLSKYAHCKVCVCITIFFSKYPHSMLAAGESSVCCVWEHSNSMHEVLHTVFVCSVIGFILFLLIEIKVLF